MTDTITKAIYLLSKSHIIDLQIGNNMKNCVIHSYPIVLNYK